MEQCGARPLPPRSHTDVPGLPRAHDAAVVEGPPETWPGHCVKLRSKVLEKVLPLGGPPRRGEHCSFSPARSLLTAVTAGPQSPLPPRAAQDFTEFLRNRSTPRGEGKAWFPGGTCRTRRSLPGPAEGAPPCPALAPSSVMPPPWVCPHKARARAPVCGDRRQPAGPGQPTPPWCCVTDRTEWKGLLKPTDFVLLTSVPGTDVFVCRENSKKHIGIV